MRLLFYNPDDFFEFRITFAFQFRMDLLAVHRYFKGSTGTRDQFQRSDFTSEMIKQLFRKTCGFGCIISLHTKLDDDFRRHIKALLSYHSIARPSPLIPFTGCLPR